MSWFYTDLIDNKVAPGAPPLFAESADTKTVIAVWPRDPTYNTGSSAVVLQSGTIIGPIVFGGTDSRYPEDIEALATDDAGDAAIVYGTPGVPGTAPVKAERFFSAAGKWEVGGVTPSRRRSPPR